MSQLYALCPTCGEVIEAELVDNGVCMVLHGVHCGYGHHLGSLDDAYLTLADAEKARNDARKKQTRNPVAVLDQSEPPINDKCPRCGGDTVLGYGFIGNGGSCFGTYMTCSNSAARKEDGTCEWYYEVQQDEDENKECCK